MADSQASPDAEGTMTVSTISVASITSPDALRPLSLSAAPPSLAYKELVQLQIVLKNSEVEALTQKPK